MMKAFTVFMMMLAGCCLWAQDYPRFELSAGYSYGSIDTQGYGTQRQAQGWTGSFTANLHRLAGVELEASGRYNSLNFDFEGNLLTANNPYYTFLLGPRFAYRKGKVTPFAHTLFGVDRAPSYDNTVLDPQTGTGTTPFVTGFASATGGGFDYSIGRHLLLRTQGDYFFTRHKALTSPTPNNFRVLAAIVFTFGGSQTLDAKRRVNAPVTAKARASAPTEPQKQATSEPVVASANAPEPATGANQSSQPASTDFVAPVVQPQTRVAALVAAPPAPPLATTKTEAPASRTVAASTVESTPAQQPTAATTSMSSPYSVIISQPTDQQYQASQSQESLGDVARRYRLKRHGNASNGL